MLLATLVKLQKFVFEVDTLQHFGTGVFKEDNQAVRLDCDLSCAESVECNTAGLVQVLCSFLHVDFGYAFHLCRLQSDM
jgi:hypothetical protein